MNNTPNQPKQQTTPDNRPARPIRRPTRSPAPVSTLTQVPQVSRPQHSAPVAQQQAQAPQVNRPQHSAPIAQQQAQAPQVNRPQHSAPIAPKPTRTPQIARPQQTAVSPPKPTRTPPKPQAAAAPAQKTVPQPTAKPQPARAAQRQMPSAAKQPPQTAPMRQRAPMPLSVQQAQTTQVDISRRMTATDDSATRKMPLVPGDTPGWLGDTDTKKQKKQLSEAAATLISVVKAITYIVAVIVIAGFLSYYVIQVANDMFAFVKSDEQVTIEIPENSTIYNISEILAENKIITYPDVFELYAKLNKDDGKFVAGTYEINAMMNYDELLMAFKERYTRSIVRLTIPEGYTVDEIIDLFIENGVGMVKTEDKRVIPATREDFVTAINKLELYDDFTFVQNLIDNTSTERFYALEGYLFPDTYEFYTDSSPSQIFYKLLNRFDNLFKEEFYTRAADLGYTVDEMIILASMIEKETRLYYEFEQVSSVFHNRLALPGTYPYLESDATIMYAIQHDTGSRKEEMTQADWGYVSPYNTYTNKGLPPGPIANPSYQAITCALYPETTDYYFFISDTRTGQTIFSRTFAEHQAARAELAS